MYKSSLIFQFRSWFWTEFSTLGHLSRNPFWNNFRHFRLSMWDFPNNFLLLCRPGRPFLPSTGGPRPYWPQRFPQPQPPRGNPWFPTAHQMPRQGFCTNLWKLISCGNNYQSSNQGQHNTLMVIIGLRPSLSSLSLSTTMLDKWV